MVLSVAGEVTDRVDLTQYKTQEALHELFASKEIAHKAVEAAVAADAEPKAEL